MLPTSHIDRWIEELGDSPTPDDGLYGLACSIDEYCGVISPWGTQFLIFGDDPADIYYSSEQRLFCRWIGANSIKQLTTFATNTADGEMWDETTPFDVGDQDMTLMDTCKFAGDSAPRIQLKLRTGSYTIRSRYAESRDVISVVHRLDFIG